MSCCAKKSFGSCKSDVPLSSSHHKTGKSVLEDLLETEAVWQQKEGAEGQFRAKAKKERIKEGNSQLEDGEVDGGVESESSLVGSEGRVVLQRGR